MGKRFQFLHCNSYVQVMREKLLANERFKKSVNDKLVPMSAGAHVQNLTDLVTSISVGMPRGRNS